MAGKRLMRFILNGKEMEYRGDPAISLLDYLKTVADVPVTGAGCAGGGRCGACTVLIDDRAVLSCRTPMAKVAGALVSTSDESGQMIQDIFSITLRKMGTPDCHYCVPETVMKARMFLENNPEPTMEESRRVIGRDLCKCIGHNKIARSMVNAAEIIKEGTALKK
jgi:aerobic-type carbon monoxide dehydrogenase small subunit (CoxS/CutS family)